MKDYFLNYILKRLLLIIAVFAFIAWVKPTVYVSPSHPENIEDQGDPEIRAKIYGVTFPIPELGNCQNYYECRTYCEDPVNGPACIDYGKKRGFYKDETEDDVKKERILEKAKKELGCDSYETCKSFCQMPTNFDKCDAFARSQGITGGHVNDPKNEVVLVKAKEVLGCDSYASCASFCSDDSNREKCTAFAKETGLRGGERPVGPGGCTSEESCKTFCSDPQNFQVCQGFMSSSGGKFSGPGGCNSEDSCRSYCERNPQDCGPSVGGGPVPVPIKYDPQEMCNRTPACSWTGNTCQCGFYDDKKGREKAEEYAKICRENPQKCTPGGIGGSGDDFGKYCRENPEKCRPTTYDPAAECTRYAGCAWTGNYCQCSNINYSPRPASTTYPNSTYYPRSSDYPQTTSYPQTTYQPSATYQPASTWYPTQTSAPEQTSAPSQTQAPAQTSAPVQQTTESSGGFSGGSCPEGSYMKDGACVSGVQGVSTMRSWFDRILDPWR